MLTLAHSRHQYVEFVWDQTVATWLGCHRRAFEWFAGVPARVVIDNAKCAITRACAQDPTVQRAYAECAEGYGFKIDPCPPHDRKRSINHALAPVACEMQALFNWQSGRYAKAAALRNRRPSWPVATP